MFNPLQLSACAQKWAISAAPIVAAVVYRVGHGGESAGEYCPRGRRRLVRPLTHNNQHTHSSALKTRCGTSEAPGLLHGSGFSWKFSKQVTSCAFAEVHRATPHKAHTCTVFLWHTMHFARGADVVDDADEAEPPAELGAAPDDAPAAGVCGTGAAPPPSASSPVSSSTAARRSGAGELPCSQHVEQVPLPPQSRARVLVQLDKLLVVHVRLRPENESHGCPGGRTQRSGVHVRRVNVHFQQSTGRHVTARLASCARRSRARTAASEPPGAALSGQGPSAQRGSRLVRQSRRRRLSSTLLSPPRRW